MAHVRASKSTLAVRAQLGVAARLGADATELRRKLAESQLEDHIRAVVDTAPPLTAEQRDRLAALLRGGVAA